MATGVYHCYNVSKFRILAELKAKKLQGKYATSADIAAETGMDVHNVRQNLCHYAQKKRDPLIRRSEKKIGNEYQYTITAAGEKVFEILRNRIKKGMDLNMRHSYLSDEPLVKPTPAGKEQGLTEDDARKVVGL